MSLEAFLSLERQRLTEERERLIVLSASATEQEPAREKQPAAECPALAYLRNTNYAAPLCKRQKEQVNGVDVGTGDTLVSANTDQYNQFNTCSNNKTTKTTTTCVNILSSNTTNTMSSLAPLATVDSTQQQSALNEDTTPGESGTATYCLFAHGTPEYETENAAALTGRSADSAGNSIRRESCNAQAVGSERSLSMELSKHAKEWANQKELNAFNLKENNVDKEQEMHREKNRLHKNQDDMEQWVSDTFYSYFPGFNNENQKRQHYLRERQRENQENFLRHQMSHPIAKRNAAQAKSNNNNSPNDNNKQTTQNLNLLTARSSANSTASHTTTSHTTDKTDLEIIVNNPNYVPPKHYPRPGSTRHRLLQDLRHTELSHIVAGDAVSERNRRNAEMETARKQDYQRELMQQIEEKRRSIEMLREKERRQEEALTRRMQEQLKTIQLEEQLEKEKLRADKLRFDSEQNRLMREHLLAKLEHDAKLLHSGDASKADTKDKAIISKDALDTTRSNDINSTTTTNNNSNNKVYKYFSNSARHEYRRGRPLPAEVEFDLEIPELTTLNTERECFHMSDKVCPTCDVPLRSYENCCLRCQRQLMLKLNTKPSPAEVKAVAKEKEQKQEQGDKQSSAEEGVAAQLKAAAPPIEDAPAHSFSLVCVKCERLYTLCPTCVARSDVCRACHRQRNVCMNCRRTLCSFCLDEVACGRDTERSHINESVVQQAGELELEMPPVKSRHAAAEADRRAFKVLELNYAAGATDALQKTSDGDEEQSSSSPTRPYNDMNSINYTHIYNNLRNNSNNNNAARPPYSLHIERNSFFHPNYQHQTVSNAPSTFEPLPKIVDKQLSFDLDSSATDDQLSMERVRNETDKRLTRYLKNYGDMAGAQQKNNSRRSKSESRNRSTQTTPESAGRRDVVLHEEHNLSMPLLREMPKMTRSVGGNLVEQRSHRSKMQNLRCKWDVPAVQKFTISPTTPKVLTQVGAIRKQLQASSLLSDEAENY